MTPNPAPPKKKMGTLRRAFNYAGAVFLGLYLGGPSMFAESGDVTEALAQKLDLPVSTIKAMTRGRAYIMHPESDSARGFAYLTESPALRAMLLEHSAGKGRNNPHYDFMGISYSHPVFGQNGYLNKITFGQSGRLAPCYVFFPSDRLNMDAYFEAMSLIPLAQIKNRPGSWAEYQKLILFHELEHCNQPVDMPASDRERSADQAAYESYIKQGGSKDVVRAALSLRMIGTFENIIFNGGADQAENGHHSGIALLYAHYSGGSVMPPEQFAAAQDELYRAFEQAAHHQGIKIYDLLVPETLYSSAKIILAGQSSYALSAPALTLLQHYKESYEFLTRPPENKPEHKAAFKNELVPTALLSGPMQKPLFQRAGFAAGLH